MHDSCVWSGHASLLIFWICTIPPQLGSEWKSSISLIPTNIRHRIRSLLIVMIQALLASISWLSNCQKVFNWIELQLAKINSNCQRKNCLCLASTHGRSLMSSSTSLSLPSSSACLFLRLPNKPLLRHPHFIENRLPPQPADESQRLLPEQQSAINN